MGVLRRHLMPFRTRLTSGFVLMVAVCAARGQDPYAPQAAQPPQYPAPPYSPSQYPLAQYQTQPQPTQYQFQFQPAQNQQPQYGQPAQNSAAAGRYQLPSQQPQYGAPAAPYGQPQPSVPAVSNQTPRYPLPGLNGAAQVGPPQLAQPQLAQPQQPPPPQQSQLPAQNPQPAAGSVQPATNIVAAAPEPAAAQPASEGELFKPGQIVASVGDKSILYADIAPTVEMRLQNILAKSKNPQERQALEAAYREPLTKHVIEQAVFNKLLLMEFERGIPAEMRNDPKKKSEMEGKLKKQIRNNFEQSLNACREKLDTATPEEMELFMKQDSPIIRLAMLMKEKHLDSYGELDQLLKEYGTSLQQQVKDYGENMMGMEAARSKINGDDGGPKGKGKAPAGKKEVTYDDLLDYYQAHVADYYIPAKARFEILTAKFARNGGDRQKTWDLAAQMGNEVLLGGTPLPAVAKKHSQEPHASDGGYYDWVTPGSLASKPIDTAIFTLEVDKLSQIIEDDQGFHIIHVLERKDPGQISFQEAQPKIRETIEKQRRDAVQTKYMTEIRSKAKVWTIYDPPEGTAKGRDSAKQ